MPSVSRERLALDVLELATAGRMPDSFKLTDSRVGRALDVLADLDADLPAEWVEVARERAQSGTWEGQEEAPDA